MDILSQKTYMVSRYFIIEDFHVFLKILLSRERIITIFQNNIE